MDWPILLVLAVLLIALAIYGYRARPQSAVNRWFALQTLTVALWIVGIAGTHAGYYPEFWGRWTFASACLAPLTFFGFTCTFPDNSRPPSSRLLPVVVAVALSFVALSVFTPLIAHTFVITPSGLRRQAGPLMPLFSLYFLLFTVLILGLLIAKWRKATGQAKAQLRFYNTGLLILCIGATTTNLILPTVTGHSEYSTVGPFFALPLVGLICHAIIRHRLLDLRLMIHRGAAYLVFIGLASTAVVLLVKQTGLDDRFESIEVPLEAFVVLVVAAASLSLPLAPHLARLMDNYLLRSRTDLDRALQEAARRLSRQLTVPDIAKEIAAILKSMLAVDRVVVLTDQAEAQGVSPSVRECAWSVTIPPPAVLLLDREPESSTTLVRVETLRDSGFEVWVALGRGTHKTGIILLGPRNGGEAYLGSTLRFVEDLAELSSMAFEVSVLHRRQIELERERDRLEHFARMGRAYAGLGHEIRTPLTTISNLVSLIPDRLDDPEFRDVVTRLIPGEVSRLVKLTERLRLMAPGDSAQLGPVSLEKIVSDLAAMQTAYEDRIRMVLDIADHLPAVRGDESQLVQLFINLVNNAIEAMPNGGILIVRLGVSQFGTERSAVTAEVIDEGVGIPREIAEKVFEPFFTTKASGTGLGLSICREIAAFHGSTLSVHPRENGPGTIARVEFPLPSEHLSNALHDGSTQGGTSASSSTKAALT